jgi:cell division protein FtsB
VRIVILILFVILVMLQFKLWLGEGGVREVARLEERVKTQQQRNDELLQRNDRLQAEVEDLRDRLDAVEERARNELGLIKPAEEFYQVVPPPPGIYKDSDAEGVRGDGV